MHDTLSGLIATAHGFSFLWLSSFGMSAAKGLPDAGLLESSDLKALAHSLHTAVSLPLVVDADAGYGDPVKVHQLTSDLSDFGATAICIEDNPIGKRCSLYDGYERHLASIPEHVSRVQAAKLASKDSAGSISVISRTEALVAGMGITEAIRRSEAYVEAGADAIFVQSVDPTGNEIIDFCREWDRRCPVFVAPTRYPQVTNANLFEAGVSHIVFANYAVRAAHKAINDAFARLSKADSGMSIDDSVSRVEEISALVDDNLTVIETLLERGSTVEGNGSSEAGVEPYVADGSTVAPPVNGWRS